MSYDVDKILDLAKKSKADISPVNRDEWFKFCVALKFLGYSENDFIELSSCSDRESRKKWRSEKQNPGKYFGYNPDKAIGAIVNWAKASNLELSACCTDKENTRRQPRRSYNRRPAAPLSSPTPPKPNNAVFISEQQLESKFAHFRETSLYIWLCGLFPAAEVDRVFTLYRVGGSKFLNQQGGCAVCYPLINADGQCVDIKIMHVNPMTGSRKDAPPLYSYTNRATGQMESTTTTFALSRLKLSDRRAPWCNFGDHLLRTYPDADVCVVESEKSALILSLKFPSKLWIAVGSISNLNATRLQPLKHRKIMLFPDRDGIDAWSDKCVQLCRAGFSVCVNLAIKQYKGTPKDDFADVQIRKLKGIQESPTAAPTIAVRISPDKADAARIWSEMKMRHPDLIELESLLDLEPIRVTNFEDNAPFVV